MLQKIHCRGIKVTGILASVPEGCMQLQSREDTGKKSNNLVKNSQSSHTENQDWWSYCHTYSMRPLVFVKAQKLQAVRQMAACLLGRALCSQFIKCTWTFLQRKKCPAGKNHSFCVQVYWACSLVKTPFGLVHPTPLYNLLKNKKSTDYTGTKAFSRAESCRDTSPLQ